MTTQGHVKIHDPGVYAQVNDQHFHTEHARAVYMEGIQFIDMPQAKVRDEGITLTSRQYMMLLEWELDERTTLSMYPLLKTFAHELQGVYGYGVKFVSDEIALRLFIDCVRTSTKG